MKCIICRATMDKKNNGHDYWWECPVCHTIIGKKEEKAEEEKTEKDEEG